MAIRRVALGVIVSVGIACAMTSLRAECATLSLDNEFKQSVAAFVGRAADRSVLPDAEYVQTETTFEIERVWKGKPDGDDPLMTDDDRHLSSHCIDRPSQANDGLAQHQGIAEGAIEG